MNNPQIAQKSKAGLFDKLLILHLLSTALLFLFVVIAYSQLQANNFSRTFIDKSTLIRELLETTCIDPVVNTIAYDRTSKIIEALYRKNHSIAYIEIYDPTARIISSIGTSPESHLTVEQIEHQFKQKPGSEPHSALNLKETEFITPLSANGNTLGLVRVGMTKTFLQQQLKNSVLYFLGIFLVAISLTSLLYYYFTKRWILKPIVKLGAMMKNYRQDDLHALNEEIGSYNKNQAKDEIGIMSHAFGQMISSIAEYTDEIESAEKKLSQRELKYRTLMDNQSDAIFLHPLRADGFFSFTEVNSAAVKHYGYSREEFMQLSPANITPAAEVERHAKSSTRSQLLEHGQTTFETVHIKKTGEQFPVEASSVVIELDGQKYILSTVRDITERKQAEETLSKANEIINRSPAVAFQWKNEIGWPVEFVSENVEKLLGYTAQEFLDGMVSYPERVHSEDIERVNREVADNSEKKDQLKIVHEPYRLVKKSGEAIWVSDHTYICRDPEGEITCFEGVVSDITELKYAEGQRLDLETQLRQKFKMEAVGVMAGGIAHDFNNILAIVMTNLELMRRKMEEDNPLLSRLDQAQSASLRASDLIKQILTYSRQGKLDLKPVDLALVVEESLKLLRSSIPATVEILTQIDEAAKNTVISADAIQIEEVLFNLCNNAVYAMEEKGLLTISLSRGPFATGGLPVAHDLPENEYIRLTVEDTGNGMLPEVIEKIFDPFYTTKPVGSGTGMGLSISHGVVERHNGFLTVNSTPDQGSIFAIYLPIINHEEEEVVNEKIIEELPTGNERILIVDDEEALAHAVSEVLSDFGYRVTTTTDSVQALELFNSNPGQFDLVITDQTMPELTGVELSTELLKIKPGLPIILCTGYSTKITEAGAKEHGIKAFFMKPLDLSALVKATRNVLDGQEIG